MPSSDERMPSLANNLGQFFGHIFKAIKTNPASPDPNKTVVTHEVEEEQRGQMTIRRTTIEEIEIQQPDTDPPA